MQVFANTGIPFVQGGSWTRDGVILYARNTGYLEQVPSVGGTPVPLTVMAPGETAHRWPQFLPDGRRFLNPRVSMTSEKTAVLVGSLDAKPDEQSLEPLLVTDRQSWWVESETNRKTYLMFQREADLFAQPFDTDTAMLSGTPVPVASGVRAFPTATSGLWSVARNGTLVSIRRNGIAAPCLDRLDGSRPRHSWRAGALYGCRLSPDGDDSPSPSSARKAIRISG